MKRLSTFITSAVLLLTLSTQALFGQETISVSGKVTDAATSESLIGVTVVVKGSTQGVTTNVDGAYTIKAPSNATLTFS